MEKENKQVYNPLGYIDLSTIKESGASKIYKTKSAAKAQATRKKNKSISKARKEAELMKERLEEEKKLRELDRMAEKKYLLNKIAKIEKALKDNQGGGEWSVTYKVNGR
jgi:hypothetical protein